MPHLDQTTPDQIGDDVAATVEHGSSRSAGPVCTVSFCFVGLSG